MACESGQAGRDAPHLQAAGRRSPPACPTAASFSTGRLYPKHAMFERDDGIGAR